MSQDAAKIDNSSLIQTPIVDLRHEITVVNESKHQNKYFFCDICQKCFASKNDLKVHSIAHANVETFDCDVCKKSFSSEAARQFHGQVRHLGEKSHVCFVCEQRFLEKSSLIKHLSKHHGKVKSFACNLCDQIFSKRHLLQQHSHTHSHGKAKKSFECEFCKVKFHDKTTRGKHYFSVHKIISYNTNFNELKS